MHIDPIPGIEERLAWYDSKATNARLSFLLSRGIELVAATAIPIVALSGAPALASAGLGALIAIVAGLEQLFRSQETWINYRQTAEALRNELFLYRAAAGPYDEIPTGAAADKLIANRTAAILTLENTRWEAIAQRASLPEKAGSSS